ncbi:MAG: hypothetical protein DRJ49_02725 [Thermoprotei archaeon]|nr:MAG: hypothetical protein DRJ49_02725 [Thermoprotei archaeon]
MAKCMGNLDYQRVIERGLQLLESLDELDKTRKEIENQLKLKSDLKAAQRITWIMRVYVRRVGEIELIKMLRGFK